MRGTFISFKRYGERENRLKQFHASLASPLFVSPNELRLSSRNHKVMIGKFAINVTLRSVLLFTVCAFQATPHLQTLAQSKSDGAGSFALCSRDNAVEMIKQQIEVTKTFDDAVARVGVLIRGADLLWPIQQDKARAAFIEAFDLATQSEKENYERSKDRPRSVLLSMQTPDQRYVVLRAVTKRDPALAKKLTEQMLKHERETKNSFNNELTAYRLLDSAIQLLSTDINSALELARVSLNYPASSWLTRFLYKLAQVNQLAADQFYDRALVVYGNTPMREFLYFSAYPFALPESRNTPVYAYYPEVPANFALNNSLQRRFVQTFLRRAQQALEVPLDEGDNYNWFPATGHILLELMRIEPQVGRHLPDLSPAIIQAREKILVSLPAETQKTLLKPGREMATAPEKNFEEQIETAEKTPNVNQRDDLIATAVLSSTSDKESLAKVLDAIEKITESSVREPLRERLYFYRTREAAISKRFDEAERLVSKVEGLEQRAYLRTEIAKGLLDSSETQTHGREVLDEAITEANKAGKNIFTARTLLSASNLYSKVDLSRSISVLENAINFVNHISNADFSKYDNQALVKQPNRRSNPGGRFLIRFYIPGLDPETAFREMAKVNFDGALSQTNAFTDKFQRAVTTLAAADICLQQTLRQPKEKPRKTAKP